MLRVLVLAAALLVVVNSTAVKSAPRKVIVKEEADCTTFPCVVFEDNFDSFDLDVWEHEITMGGGGNWEFQYYCNNRSNSYVHDSTLFIKPTLTSDKYGDGFIDSGTIDLWGSTPASECTGNAFWGCMRSGNPANLLNPIQSARLRTAKSFGFRYGRAEIRAKVPAGDWIWPAIWMMPTREAYGPWPASGEIDLMESRGNLIANDLLGTHQGRSSCGSTLHWGPYWPNNGYNKTHGERQGNFADDFHLFRIEWTPNGVQLFVDNIQIVDATPPPGGFWDWGGWTTTLPAASNPWRYSNNARLAPFDKDFYFILNVAVGGTNGFFPDNWNYGPNGKPWLNESPTAFADFWNARGNWQPSWDFVGENSALQVDYVRVTKLDPDPVD